MNEKLKKIDSRYRNIVAIIVMLMLLLSGRLFVLTIIQHEKWSSAENTQNTKTIYTPAPRGNIYDRDGNLLAGNRQIFAAVFNPSNLTTEEINNSSLLLINKLMENKEEFIDDFPVLIDEGGNFTYSYKNEQSEWLKTHNFSPAATAEDVFNKYRTTYSIDPKADRYEANKTLKERYNIYLPINIKRMKFTFESDLENFLLRFGFSKNDISKGIDPKECFKDLRESYYVDETLSDTEARKIFVVRNKISEQNFQRYLPITIAVDISDKSVIYFEEQNLAGVTVSPQTERYYPNGKTACHIIGYLGSISEGESDYYIKERKYLTTDLVGKDGIESAMEESLHGTAGVKTIMINSNGEYVSTLNENEGKKGNDVYLTIQLKLQQAVEKALEKAVNGTENARSGAAVVLDVKTADVLAMASYPDFDINSFADGISAKEWAAVQPENPRAAFSPAPLFNNATRAAVSPGSTFKPLTALTALSCGLNPYLKIQDKGFIKIGSSVFGCYTWNNYKATDGFEDLEYGMGYSCNYYFACIATNWDYINKTSLGYHKSISIDDIIAKAHDYGLDQPTGIEIGETVRPAVSKEKKTEAYKQSLSYALYEKARIYFPPEIYNDRDKLSKNISTIVGWIYENPEFNDLIELIRTKTDVLEDQAEACANMVKFDYFNFTKWTEFDVFNVSIGQGDNAYTPIQVANYIATIGNNGIRNNVNLVYGVEGKGKTVKPEPFDTNTPKEDIEAVKTGMRRVCLIDKLGATLGTLPYNVIGKTGTAQYQAIKQPESEVEYLKSHLSEINSYAGTSVTWEQVQEKAKEIIKKADEYLTEENVIDDALIEASDYHITMTVINRYKETYDDFAWIVTLAPKDDPQVCVVLMLPEGGLASEVGEPVADIYKAYFENNTGVEKKHVGTENTGSNKWQ